MALKFRMVASDVTGGGTGVECAVLNTPPAPEDDADAASMTIFLSKPGVMGVLQYGQTYTVTVTKVIAATATKGAKGERTDDPVSRRRGGDGAFQRDSDARPDRRGVRGAG